MLRRELLKGLTVAGMAALSWPVRAQDARTIVNRIGLMDGRVVTSVTIGDAGPYLFLLDTGGATSLIEEALARELHLTSTGSVAAYGVGGAARLPTYTARDVVFGGGVRQPMVSLAGMKGGFGRKVRGTLAAGVLTSVDSDLDIESGEWRIYPDGRPSRTGFVEMEKAIRTDSTRGRNVVSPRLFGPVQVDGRNFDCLLDTGAPGGISLSHDVARKLGLWNDDRPYVPQGSKGIGGSGGVGRIVRADSALFGGIRFERPLVLLRSEKDGARYKTDGIVGLDVLRLFNLSTDVRTRSLWVRRHAIPVPPDRYGMSGLWLDDTAKGIRVAAVGTGSPAAAAGALVDDVVVSKNFREVLAAITGQPGKQVALRIARPSGESTLRFTLRPYL